MQDVLVQLVAFLAALSVATLVAPRLRVPAPLLMVVLGVLVGLLPGLHAERLHPDLVLLLFLPPLLYADAFHTSWRDFHRWLRPILMLAIGLVVATTLAVGAVVHLLLPTLPWTVCLLVGAVLSPTDTVAAQAALEHLRVPRRVTAIIGGESLVNDATGLLAVQLGVAALVGGALDAGSIPAAFARIAGLGIAVGLVAGALAAWLNRVVRRTDALFALSLLAPYAAYAAATALDASAVLAVVTAGFFVAWRIHTVHAEARVALYAGWDHLAFLLNGACFLFVGAATPVLLRDMPSASGALTAALAAAATVIVVRVLWCVPGAYLPLWLSRRLRAREGGYPPAAGVAVVAWSGMRGAISLAAALALPATVPGRDVVVLITLVVIGVTLLAQGATLEPLVRRLGLQLPGDEADEGRRARVAALDAGIARLDAFCSETACPIAVHHLRHAMADRLASLREQDAADRSFAERRLEVSAQVRAAVRTAQAAELLRLRDAGTISDATHIALQLELDRGQL